MKQTVKRYFNIANGYFIMFSRTEGEFGIQELQTQASNDEILQIPSKDSAPCDFNFRLGELQFFISIYHLFNPQLQVDYGLPTESQTQEDLP